MGKVPGSAYSAMDYSGWPCGSGCGWIPVLRTRMWIKVGEAGAGGTLVGAGGGLRSFISNIVDAIPG